MTDTSVLPTSVAEEPWVQIHASRRFPAFLAEQRISLAFSTYQTAKLFMIGLRPDGQLAVFERTFNRCMGLWAGGQTLWMGGLYQLWRFENALRNGNLHEGCDRLYVPRMGYTTGDIDMHDIVVEEGGRVIFVSTLFSCLATLDGRFSFSPLWHPPFVSRLAPEDRCHLNGVATVEGRVRYVTAVSTTDVADGWRDRRRDGGVVIDVRGGRIIAEGLSMPHSPRFHQGRLWLHDSGTGHFGWIDPAGGGFRPLAFCPGYLRGLCFSGDYAIMGLSRPRRDNTFGGLALDENLKAGGAEARAGLHVIDLRTGDCVHWLRVEGMVSELYDVVALPGVVRPAALGFKTEEIQRMIAVGDEGTL